MTREEVFEIAIEAGWHGGEARGCLDALETFAKILAHRILDDYLNEETRLEMRARGEIN
jgi:hypothetical protein